MKYTTIATFFLMIQISLALLTGIGLFNIDKEYSSDWFAKVDNAGLEAESYVSGEAKSPEVLGFGDFLKGLYTFVKNFGLAIVWVPKTFETFGMLSPLTYYFSLPIYFIYGIAIIQLISNRSFKGME